MIPRADPTDGSAVARADLANAVEAMAGVTGKPERGHMHRGAPRRGR